MTPALLIRDSCSARCVVAWTDRRACHCRCGGVWHGLITHADVTALVEDRIYAERRIPELAS